MMGSRRRNFAAFLLNLTAKDVEFFAKRAKRRVFGERHQSYHNRHFERSREPCSAQRS